MRMKNNKTWTEWPTQDNVDYMRPMRKQTRKSAITDCTARRMWNVKRASFLFGVGAFRPKFYGNRVILCQNVDTTW